MGNIHQVQVRPLFPAACLALGTAPATTREHSAEMMRAERIADFASLAKGSGRRGREVVHTEGRALAYIVQALISEWEQIAQLREI